MSDIIKLLPDAIANQIAAGEVVQRPASAVKELLENAVDAGASKIELVIRDGGKSLIQVIDDGAGMSTMDARMCFERHATSKIKASADLFNIRTKGFRGEAMASIAAVAQVEMKTRRAEDDLGTEIEIAGSEIRYHRSTACPKGTLVSIRNLFFNVPARRNFLKSTASEARNVINEFLRVALAHPGVSFRMEHQDALIYDLPKGDLLDRILQVFGADSESDLIRVEEHTPYVSITGFVSKPQSARKMKGDQYFFVNDRYIRDPALNHAVVAAYENTLKQEEYPLYVLYLNLDPKHIDINIHPTKTEVKFDDSQGVYTLLKSSVRKALGMFHLKPEVQSLGFTGPGLSAGDTSSDTTLRDFSRQKTSRISSDDWQALFGPARNTPAPTVPEKPLVQDTLFQSRESVPRVSASEIQPTSGVPENTAWVLHQRFIFMPVSQGLMCIDPQAARERVLYEQYLKNNSRIGAAPQLLLYPQTLVFSPSEAQLLQEREEMIQAAGFDLRGFGKNTWLLSALPPEIRPQDAKEILDTFLLEPEGGTTPHAQLQDKLARSIAKASRLPKDFMLNSSAARQLIQQWQGCEQPQFTPDGQAVSWILTTEEILKRFR